jgi:Lrp/AsnC family leucine-responsive transcriptional regulator
MAADLDSIDLQILDLLQRDGRMAEAAIGKRVGLSQPSVHERIKKLVARGVIMGYTARVNPDALGLGMLAFISVRFQGKTDEVARRVAELPQVLEAHHTAGDDCLLVKVRCRTPADLERVVDRIWESGPVIASTKTTIAFSSYKETAALPVETCAEVIEEERRGA